MNATVGTVPSTEPATALLAAQDETIAVLTEMLAGQGM
jgi:hypothetical protein